MFKLSMLDVDIYLKQNILLNHVTFSTLVITPWRMNSLK